jgi:hypothetical protein
MDNIGGSKNDTWIYHPKHISFVFFLLALEEVND